jgi:hypothetical protein
MIISVLQLIPKERTRAMDFQSHGHFLVLNRVAMGMTCVSWEIRTGGGGGGGAI